MKFPVVFRIYAVLNLLIAFITALFAVIMFVPEMSGLGDRLLMACVLCSITIWLLTSSVIWFFGSRYSYHFLFTLSLLFIALAAGWVHFVVDNDRAGKKDFIPTLLIIGGPCVLYVIFLITASFYKPVVQWTEKRFSAGHYLIFTGVVVFISVSCYIYGIVNKEKADIGVYYSVTGNGQIGPDMVNGNTALRIDLGQPVMVNGFSMPVPSDQAAQISKKLLYARLYYSDSAFFDFASHMTSENFKPRSSRVITFKQSGDELVAEFPAVKAMTLELYPMEDDEKEADTKEVYWTANLKPVWFFGFFDNRKPEVFQTDQVGIAEEGESGDYEGEGDYDDSSESDVDEGDGTVFTTENLPHLYESFFNGFSQENVGYYFGPGSIRINEVLFGMYKGGLASLRYNLGDGVKIFMGFTKYDYDRYFLALSGRPLYDSQAGREEEGGNGTKFNNLNPEIIQWCEKNLLLDSEASVAGYNVQQLYDNVFSRYLRLMVLSHEYLDRNGYDQEVQIYTEAALDDQFYGPAFLTDRYSGVRLDSYQMEDENSEWIVAADCIGFWLRRRVDETDDESWKALTTVMEKYDAEWFSSSHEVP